MNDTPKYILQKQFEIIYSKPLREKISGLLSARDFEFMNEAESVYRKKI